jgi:hypothetical protein
MSDEFSRRYSTSGSSSSKPDCYGDEDYYDRDDSTCRACASNTTCGLVVRRKLKKEESSSPSRARTATTRAGASPRKPAARPRREAQETIDPGEGETFGEVALYNSATEAAQGFLDTIASAWSHVPRKTYKGNIFGGRKK